MTEIQKSMIGKRFGNLSVIDYKKNQYYLCRCDCGNKKSIRKDKLISGDTKSCGCIKVGRKVVHGDSYKRLYRIYSHMKDRCYNKNMHAFKHYGGRSISVCQEWLLNYQTFKEWALKNGYSDNLSIDRIDVNGNYEPSNCRWITQQQQSLNKRDNVYIEYKGEVKTIKEWADKLNVPRHIISKRYHSQVKYSVEEILFTPKGELQGKKV